MGHYDSCREGYCARCGAGPGNIEAIQNGAHCPTGKKDCPHVVKHKGERTMHTIVEYFPTVNGCWQVRAKDGNNGETLWVTEAYPSKGNAKRSATGMGKRLTGTVEVREAKK